MLRPRNQEASQGISSLNFLVSVNESSSFSSTDPWNIVLRFNSLSALATWHPPTPARSLSIPFHCRTRNHERLFSPLSTLALSLPEARFLHRMKITETNHFHLVLPSNRQMSGEAPSPQLPGRLKQKRSWVQGLPGLQNELRVTLETLWDPVSKIES